MAFPNWLQSLPRRLSFLGRPSVIASCSATVIFGIFIWEYAYHPEWFGRYSPDETSPPSSANVPALSPEERAAVADIDDLTVLLNQLGADENGIPTIQALPEAQRREPDPLLQELLALSEPADGQLTTEQTPFAKYLEQYRFESPAASDSRQGTLPSSFADILADLDRTSTVDTGGVSPLAYALQNQVPAERESLSADPTDTNTARSQAVPERSESTEVTEMAEQTEEFSSRGVIIPGIPFPVLPTTSQMSPPPGSTGYTPPASLQLIPPLPGSTATGVLPVPGTLPLDASPGLTSPSIPANRATPDLSAPQIDTSNGYASPYTPYTPTAPSVIQGGTEPGVSVFSVPRPPGSYIGGGYINTFSNPSGPPN